MADLIWLIPALPLAGFLVNGLAGRRLPRVLVGLVGCAGPVASLVLSILAFRDVALGPTLSQSLWSWIAAGDVAVDIGLKVDALSGVMILVVTGIGSLIHIYSIGYMGGDPGYSRYFAYLNLFLFSMLILVLADNLLVMFVGWEGVGLCSYLLIGFWYEDLKNADAGKKAFVVNRVGDFGFLLGILLLVGLLGTLNFDGMKAAIGPEHGAALAAAAGLLFIGACGKSAQIPLHVWLPDAMAGPTPVSALIHAATMVTAGVYMIGRLAFLYREVPEVLGVIAVVASLTALMAAALAVGHTDIKKILAYSTISQLGFMFAGMAAQRFHTGIFHIVTHAFFKALLFLGAGAVIHALHGQQDIRRMGGLRRTLPLVCLTFICGTIALAGVPGTSGFFSKDAILSAVYERMRGEEPAFGFAWYLLLGTAFLTAFYATRLYVLVFLGTPREEQNELHKPGLSMTVPLTVLAIGSIFVGGLLERPFEEFLASSVGTPAPYPRMNEITAHAHHVNTVWSWILSLSGLGVAFLLYALRGDLVTRAASSDIGRAMQKAAARGFYIDDLYHWAVVVPLRTTAAGFWYVVDRLLIDRALVEGTAGLAYRLGRAVKAVHTGVVSLAAGAMALGAAAILGYLVWWFLNHG